jgi:transposase-like protein
MKISGVVAEKRLIKHHSLSKKFPLYLKEIELRYSKQYDRISNSLENYGVIFVSDLFIII